MKADVAIPNPVFEAAEQLALKLGVSLSELYTAALVDYLAAYQSDDVTESLDQLYETESSTIDPELVRIQVKSVDGGTW